MEPTRLNKFLSERGVASRREADRLIAEGRVSVNGRPAEAGMKVTEFDRVLVSGKAVEERAPEKAVYMLNKPRGVVTTTKSFHGEQNVLEFLPEGVSAYPIGRLDKDSEGLLLLTNDGALAKEITTAGRHEKEYEVTVNKDLTEHFLNRMEKGVYIPELDRETAKAEVRQVGRKKFRIVLQQGLNRQIRRMAKTLGYTVVSLKRIRVLNLTLGNLKSGECRRLTDDEYAALRRAAFPDEAAQQ